MTMNDLAPPQLLFIQCQTPDQAKIRVRKGSKSTARAHIIKQLHRRHRLERMQAFRDDLGSVPLPHRINSQSPDDIVKSEADDEDSKPLAEDEPQQYLVLASNYVQTMLSQNRADPFSSLGELPVYMQQVLDHAVTITWPATVPTEGATPNNPIKNVWMKCAMDNPVMLHAFLWAASLHLSAVSNGHELVKSGPMLRLAEKTKTIEMINQQLRKLDGPPHDALIMAVCTLAIHGEIDRTPQVHCHPLSPLATQNYLHVYGQIQAAEEHIYGLMLLIKEKGGIDNIQTYGMRTTLNLADTFFATKYIMKPNFPWDTTWSPIYRVPDFTMDPVAEELDTRLRSGFQYLDNTPDLTGLLEVLKHIIEITVALDQHTRKGKGAPHMSDIVNARNVTQHAITSINFDPTTEDTEIERTHVGEVCRLAALVYCDMVIVPLPPCQGLKPRLAARLQSEIEHSFKLLTSKEHARLFTWVIVLGAISASFTSMRPWFLRLLQMQMEQLEIDDWTSLQELCQDFLWWKPVCEEPLIRIGAELAPPPEQIGKFNASPCRRDSHHSYTRKSSSG